MVTELSGARAAKYMIDAWTARTEGVCQCAKCGRRVLTPAEMVKVPQGWAQLKDERVHLPARWDIWGGVCDECVRAEGQ